MKEMCPTVLELKTPAISTTGGKNVNTGQDQGASGASVWEPPFLVGGIKVKSSGFSVPLSRISALKYFSTFGYLIPREKEPTVM